MNNILMIASEASHFRNFHIPYIKHLLRNGKKVFTTSNDNFELDGVTHFSVPFKKKLINLGNVGAILRLARFIRRQKIDTVCTNSTLAGFMGRMAAVLSGRKPETIHICHGYLFNDDGSTRTKIYLFFERLVRKHTDVLAVMNKDDLAIAQKYNLGKQIVFLNGMGLDTEKFPQLLEEKVRSEYRRLCQIGDKDENFLLFLCAAEFSPRKSQHTIIKALSLLKRSDCKVIFAGEGELLEECKTLARQLKVEDKTVFLGHIGDMNLLYRCCDCLISAGRFEGLPFNVMEALYCGENVIASDVKGNNDLVSECGGRRGQLFTFEDADGLCALMEKAQKPVSRGCGLPEKYFLGNALDKNLKLLKMKS